jgi:hypothetical protein
MPTAWRSDHLKDPEISGMTLHEKVRLRLTAELDPGISGSLKTPPHGSLTRSAENYRALVSNQTH